MSHRQDRDDSDRDTPSFNVVGAPASATAPHHARGQLLLSLAAVAAPSLGMVATMVFAPLDPVRIAALGGLVLMGVALSLTALWRRARAVDALANRLAPSIGQVRHAREPLERIAGAVAALNRRLAAHDAAGDPARRDDPTTGLPNRQTAMRRARDEISRARRVSQPLSVALIALDIGPRGENHHIDGQQGRALRLTAEFLMQGLRAYDVVARWDHDLFVALLPEAEVENAVGAVERVRAMAGAGWSIRGGEPLPAIYGGIAVLQPDDATLGEIVARAERALNRARGGVGSAVQAAPGPRSQPARLTPV